MSNCPETGLPLGESRPALEYRHFPTRWQAVLWRNWGLVTPARLAAVLGTVPETLGREAAKMELGPGACPETEALWLRRGYITLVRQNWHLLPYRQLLELLGITAAEMAYRLKEEDFLFSKLGRLKPETPPVNWEPLSAGQEKATAALAETVRNYFGEAFSEPPEKPFAFLGKYGQRAAAPTEKSGASPFGLRLAYSYSAVYGDPLLDENLDPYPDGLLAGLADSGINAVWLQGVLYTLVPWFGETAHSEGWQKRLENLDRLVRKAAGHGISIYLYINEPRGMSPSFYDDFPGWRGNYHPYLDRFAMCVSNPEILEMMKAGLTRLFREVPGLAGVFTITMSENLTHCFSKTIKGKDECPRCAGIGPARTVAAVNNAVADGIRAAKPEADIIAWCWAWWSWPGDWWKEALDLYRPGIRVMSTSEVLMPTVSGGIAGRVQDYTMSRPGPGPFSREAWRHAREKGLETVAKIQANNTWECSAVPWLPVPFLVRRHIDNLAAEGVSGLMTSWTLGGHPGGNLPVIDRDPEELALADFGPKAAPAVVEAWRKFGEAFAEFPLNGTSCLYRGPQNYGPMNLLFSEPTGWNSTMIGFPYDHLLAWRGDHYPEDVFEDQFRRLSEGWAEGLKILESAENLVPEDKKHAYRELRDIAAAAWCHFRSVFLQVRFIRLRDGNQEPGTRQAMIRVLDEEIAVARRLREISRRDSRIGFEASNHYYYTGNALVEKVLNCEGLKARLAREEHPAGPR